MLYDKENTYKNHSCAKAKCINKELAFTTFPNGQLKPLRPLILKVSILTQETTSEPDLLPRVLSVSNLC